MATKTLPSFAYATWSALLVIALAVFASPLLAVLIAAVIGVGLLIGMAALRQRLASDPALGTRLRTLLARLDRRANSLADGVELEVAAVSHREVTRGEVLAGGGIFQGAEAGFGA